MQNPIQLIPISTRAMRPSRDTLVVLLLMLMSAVVSFRVFFPHLRDINIFDEAYYMSKGQLLLHGELPILAENPLVAAFWAVTSLPFASSPHWMMHTYGLGRFVIFVLLWTGMYAVGRAGRAVIHPLIPIGFLFVAPGLLGLLDNSTDGLFAAVSAFGLARFMEFMRTKRTRHGLQASCLLGLAVLSRNDGLVLIGVAILLTLGLSGRHRGIARRLGAIILPAAFIILTYVAVQSLATGQMNMGIARRSYDAFEQGEGVAFQTSYGSRNPYVEGYDAARRRYGSPEENRYSIMRAIMMNPSAFAQRTFSMLVQTPAQMFAAYGRGLRGFGAVLLLLALRGAIELWRHRNRTMLLILVLWCSHLGVYLFTFFREGYFLLVYAPVFYMAAIGTAALFRQDATRWEMPIASGTLLALIVYAILSRSDLLLWPGVVFLLGLMVVWCLFDQDRLRISASARTLLGVGAVLFIFSAQIQFSRPARLALPRLPKLGTAADEMAAGFLVETQREGTPVAAYTVAPITMSRMYYVAPHIDARGITSDQDLLEWIARRNVHVFYVDDNFRSCEPELWEIMGGLIGTHLRVAFHAEDDYQAVDILFH